MPEIIITRTISVPYGPYCGECDQIDPQQQIIIWDGGLGSPGAVCLYHCKAFDVRLQERMEPANTPTGRRVQLVKCETCLSATQDLP